MCFRWLISTLTHTFHILRTVYPNICHSSVKIIIIYCLNIICDVQILFIVNLLLYLSHIFCLFQIKNKINAFGNFFSLIKGKKQKEMLSDKFLSDISTSQLLKNVSKVCPLSKVLLVNLVFIICL